MMAQLVFRSKLPFINEEPEANMAQVMDTGNYGVPRRIGQFTLSSAERPKPMQAIEANISVEGFENSDLRPRKRQSLYAKKRLSLVTGWNCSIRHGGPFQSTACMIRPSGELDACIAPLRKYGNRRNAPSNYSSQKFCQNVSELGRKFSALKLRSFEKHMKQDYDLKHRRRSCVSLFDLSRAKLEGQTVGSVPVGQQRRPQCPSSMDTILETVLPPLLTINDDESVLEGSPEVFTEKSPAKEATSTRARGVTEETLTDETVTDNTGQSSIFSSGSMDQGSPEPNAKEQGAAENGLKPRFSKRQNRSARSFGTSETPSWKRLALKRNQTFSEGAINELSSIFTCKFGSDRALWSTLRDTVKLGILETMDPNSIQIQEKIFEIVSSEATYLRSLDLLVKHFMESTKLSGYVSQGSVISFVERKNLFSTILEVRKGSRRLLNALFLSVKNCIMLDEIFEILADHLADQESAYISYCSNVSYQQKTLRKLRETNQEFCKAIKRIEKVEELRNQSLSSFLMQPMQRVTRYPLMVDAVLRDLDEKDRRIDSVRKAQEVANRMVSKCDQTIKCFERMEELLELESSLTYKSSSPRRFPLISEKRFFQMKDSFHVLYTVNRPSGRFGWTSCVLFLFSDMLMITKASDHGQFIVKGYCERKFIKLSSSQSCFIPLSKSYSGFFCSLKYVFFCVFEKDHSGERTEVAFATEEKKQMDRWVDALEETNDPNGQTRSLICVKNDYCTVPRRSKKAL